MRKTYLAEFMSEKRVKNEGQADQKYITNNHIAIITREQWDLVQAEIERRNNIRSYTTSGRGKHTSMYGLSGIMCCKECGGIMRRFKQTKTRTVWICTLHQEDGKQCSMQPIEDTRLMKALAKSVNKLIEGKDEFVQTLTSNIETSLTDYTQADLTATDSKIAKVQQIVLAMAKSMADSGNTTEFNAVATELNKLIEQRNQMQKHIVQMKLSTYRMDDIKKLIEQETEMQTCDDNMARLLLEKVIVENPYKVEFVFKAGISIISVA